MNKRRKWMGLAFLILLISVWNIYILTAEYRKYEQQKNSFNETRSLIEFSKSVADFVHESQKERGMSAAYLGSGGADVFASRLREQRRLSDEKFAELMRRVGDLKRYKGYGGLEGSIDSALQKKKQLAQMRTQVGDLNVSAAGEIDFFTALNTDFLGLIPLAAKAAPTREIALRLYDSATALECKEKAGIERATLAHVFAAKEFLPGMYERAVSIHGVHEACMHSLQMRASTIESEIFKSTIEKKPFLDARRYYDQAMHGNFSIGAAVWFDTMSAKIDLLKEMNEQFNRFLSADLDRLENSTLQQHWIFLIGSFLFAFIMLVSTILILRKLSHTLTDLRISSAVFESHEGVVVTDRNGFIVRVNPAFETITGYVEAEVIGHIPSFLQSQREDEPFNTSLWETLVQNGHWAGEVINRRKNGEFYPEGLSVTALKDEDGNITHFVAIFSDITLKKESEEKIHQLAFYDPLTGLPNRRLFIDRLEHALIKSNRIRTYGVLAFIDLDNFKIVNDTKGHLIGDELLIQASERLLQMIRLEDTVARLGGDEFVIMAEEFGTTRDEAMYYATLIAEKIIRILREPFEIGGEQFYLSGSVGMALFFDHEKTVNEILAQADTAMYSAKNAGRNTYRFFDADLQDALLKRIDLEKSLYLALERHEFELFYQLQYNDQADICGVEALIRWHHPAKGLISPVEFIPIAEESNLIVLMGNWILTEACRTLREWSADPKLKDKMISVNISSKQFLAESFVPSVINAIEEFGVQPHLLRLELTESLLANEIETIHRVMNALRAYGITFSLDDFGTGYSSLSYLKQFAFDEIKIDKSFVRDIHNNRNDSSLIKAIIAMGHALEMEVIAEGVETQEQCQLLREMECHRYQGFYFARPLPKEELKPLFTKGAF